MTFELPRLLLPHRSFAQRLRSWFFTGLVVFGPLGLTVYVAWWLVSLIDNWVRPLAPARACGRTPICRSTCRASASSSRWSASPFSASSPPISPAARLVGAGEAMLDRTPVLRSVYKSLKQIFETIFREGGTQFRKVGLVEYPAKGQWSIVFISSEPPPAIADALGNGADDLRVSALHAESDHRLLLLCAGQGRHRVGDHAERGGATRDVGRAHPADAARAESRSPMPSRRATPARVD